MRKMRFSLVILFVLAFSSTAFASTGTIKNSGVNKYKSVMLTPEIYNNANPDLSDILIKAPNGDSVPYFINTSSDAGRFLMQISPEYALEEREKHTLINIKGLKNLRLEEICIEADGIFSRRLLTPSGLGKEIYSLPSGEKDTSLSFKRQRPIDDILAISIQNNDDKPIAITGITVRYYADELVFEGKANEIYTLEFGADNSKRAPVYDIYAYKDEILKESIDQLNIEDIKITKPAKEKTPAQYDFKLIFNVVVVLVAVLLGFVILKSLRKKQ